MNIKIIEKLNEKIKILKNQNDINDSFWKNIFIFLEKSLKFLSEEDFDSVFIYCCSIIESLASKRGFDNNYKHFIPWIVENKLNDFKRDLIKNELNFENVLDKWNNVYLDIYGSTRGFKKIILESYKKLDKMPSLVMANVKIENGTEITTLDIEVSEEIAINRLKKAINNIYTNYRNKLVHSATSIPFSSKIGSIINFGSSETTIIARDMLVICLDCIEAYNK
jgi:hypothetical protein